MRVFEIFFMMTIQIIQGMTPHLGVIYCCPALKQILKVKTIQQTSGTFKAIILNKISQKISLILHFLFMLHQYNTLKNIILTTMK